MNIMYLVVWLAVLILTAAPLGRYIARVFAGGTPGPARTLRFLEKAIYRFCGVKKEEEMSWQHYAGAFSLFTLSGIVLLFILQRCQGLLPLNPGRLGSVRWDIALNTAISFATNTNWQSYGGETTMSYLTQMLGMTAQNFISAAAGIAPLAALFRGFTRKNAATVGSFWVDLVRTGVYILLPLSLLWALVLVSQGVVQTFRPSVPMVTLEGRTQNLSVGPVASQIAIKQLGSNGGGFYNANAAHPLENPTPFSNFMELLAILLLPAAMPFAFGYTLKRRRLGTVFFSSMLILFLAGLALITWAEHRGNPALRQAGIIDGSAMEGKEVRFGIMESALWAQATTVTSNGSVNAMHDSFMPISGIPLLFNMAVGEVIFGGVGVGLIGLIFYAILTMFLCGLMIGRTPELLGKKLEPGEMTMSVIALIGPCLVLLLLTTIAMVVPMGLASRSNQGPHGFSEILYAFASAVGNNGSAFAGLKADTVFYNLMTGTGMLAGRFLTIIPGLAVAGSLAGKKTVPQTTATFPVETPLFLIILCGVIVVVGALTFFPAVVIGPFLEHVLLNAGRTF